MHAVWILPLYDWRDSTKRKLGAAKQSTMTVGWSLLLIYVFPYRKYLLNRDWIKLFLKFVFAVFQQSFFYLSSFCGRSGNKHSLFTYSPCFNSDAFKLYPFFFITFRTALLPSFCSVSFSLWFTAGPQGRGACLLTLSPVGTSRKLAIPMSKYVHANLPILRGIVGCLLAYRERGKVFPVSCRTWVQQSNCYGSLKRRKKILMCSYLFRNTIAQSPVKVVEFKTVQL